MLLDFETLFSELHQYHELILYGVGGWEGSGMGVGMGWVLRVGGKPKVG